MEPRKPTQARQAVVFGGGKRCLGPKQTALRCVGTTDLSALAVSRGHTLPVTLICSTAGLRHGFAEAEGHVHTSEREPTKPLSRAVVNATLKAGGKARERGVSGAPVRGSAGSGASRSAPNLSNYPYFRNDASL